MRLVLLPGMDGTGELFKPLLESLSSDLPATCIAYPTHEAWGYHELLGFVRQQLPRDESFVLLGESFSGPLALQIAANPPENLRALILVCTFQSHPRPILSAFSFPAKIALQMTPPQWLISSLLTNGCEDLQITGQVQSAVRQVSATTMRARLTAIENLSAFIDTKPIQLPALYLQATQDRVVPKNCLEPLKVRMPQLELRSIHGPHCLLQVSPQASLNVIVKFLQAQNLLDSTSPQYTAS
jgi:pimeloyl-ACP methyl ester carboxylesterase